MSLLLIDRYEIMWYFGLVIWIQMKINGSYSNVVLLFIALAITEMTACQGNFDTIRVPMRIVYDIQTSDGWESKIYSHDGWRQVKFNGVSIVQWVPNEDCLLAVVDEPNLDNASEYESQ
ncbi:MAG TPA: hypothetical protein VI603_11870, partial [Saprospiraceae bacterium]|nr:hypothetical protein [Saprospiraceae bacterium]